jgi:ribonuclease D
LSAAQIQYAADDVIYLCKIYQLMCEKLEALGRLNWLEKDFKRLENTELYQLSPVNAWLKVKGRNKLTGKQLSIVQSLSEWREQTAQSENRPKNWLIRDDLLLELAKLQPETINELSNIRSINERTVRRYGKVICHKITEAKTKTPIPAKDKTNSSKKTQIQEAVLDVLTAVVRIRADENSLNPMILASRKDLEKLLFDGEDNALLQGWRYSMVGKELQGLLDGQYALTLKKDNIFIAQSE